MTALRAGLALIALGLSSGAGCHASDRITQLPASASQGALVIGRTAPGNTVTLAGRRLRTSAGGVFVFGIARDQTGVARIDIAWPDGARETDHIAIVPRDWALERINGVPPKTVNPPPAIAERIRREQAQVTAARNRDDDRGDFASAFAWPVQGRISGRFGSGRVYNGQAGAGHSGMDIAAPAGTPVKAPAGGVVSFAAPDLYLTGGTVLIDHGHGVSSNFLHLSRIDVTPGDRVAQGQVIGAVGATGRATGPHLHWGMNWFEVRVDPLLLVQPGTAAGN